MVVHKVSELPRIPVLILLMYGTNFHVVVPEARLTPVYTVPVTQCH